MKIYLSYAINFRKFLALIWPQSIQAQFYLDKCLLLYILSDTSSADKSFLVFAGVPEIEE